MNKKRADILFGLIFLVIGVAIGFWVGSHGGSLVGPSLKSQIRQAQSDLDRAKKVLPPIAEHTFEISGVIKSVGDSSMMLEANLFNPLEDIPLVRTVTITKTTRIIVLKQKDQLAYQKELIAFEKAMTLQSQGKAVPVMQSFPAQFQRVPGSLVDLKPGRSVNVIAGEDIMRKVSFEAIEIQVSIDR